MTSPHGDARAYVPFASAWTRHSELALPHSAQPAEHVYAVAHSTASRVPLSRRVYILRLGVYDLPLACIPLRTPERDDTLAQTDIPAGRPGEGGAACDSGEGGRGPVVGVPGALPSVPVVPPRVFGSRDLSSEISRKLVR